MARFTGVRSNGPLFFAAADRIIEDLIQSIDGLDGVVLHMRYSAYLDAGGLSAIEKLMAHCEKAGVTILFSSWQFQALKTLARAQGDSNSPLSRSFANLDSAIGEALERSNHPAAE